MSTPDLHFVALAGSLRRASFSRAIAHTLDELAPDDVAVEVLAGLGEIPLYDQDVQRHGFPSSVEDAAAAIGGADAVVIVTPEYNHAIPGMLKNALDWFSRLGDKPFNRMPVAIQTSSPGLLGGVRAHENVRQVLAAMNATVLNRPEVIVTQVSGKVDEATGRLRDAATRNHIADQLRALAELARPGRGHGG